MAGGEPILTPAQMAALLAVQNRELERLKTELGRAYRAVHGLHNAHKAGTEHALAYHSPTIGAAARFVREGSLDGSEYFIGKPVEVLHAALSGKPTGGPQ